MLEDKLTSNFRGPKSKGPPEHDNLSPVLWYNSLVDAKELT